MNAMEMVNTLIEKGKAAMEPAMELNSVAKNALSQLTEQQVALLAEYGEFGKRGLQSLSNIRDPKAVVDQQVELTREFGNKLIDNAHSYVKLATATRTQFVEWAERSTELAIGKAESLVSKAA